MLTHHPVEHLPHRIHRSRVTAILYSLVVCGFTYFLSFWLFSKAPQTYLFNLLKTQWWMLILMWIPGIIAFIFRGLAREGFADVGWKIGDKSYWIVAILAPFLAAAFTYSIAWVAGKVTISLAIFQEPMFADTFGILPSTWPVGTPHSFIIRLGLKFILVLSIGMIPEFIFAMGEELGWRGYLQGHLIQGKFPYPYVLCGFIWALWHMPWLTRRDWLEVALFIICITLLGIWIGWLRQASGSVWVAGMAHAAHNGFFFTLFAASFQTKAPYWVSEAGILPIFAYGIVLIVLYLNRRFL